MGIHVKLQELDDIMEIKKTWLIIGLIIILTAIILRLGTPRNRWVCVRGQWLAQGEPHGAQPQKACLDEFSVETELAELSSLLDDSFFKKEGSSPASAVVLPEESVQSDEISSSSSSLEIKPEKMIELISPQPGGVMRSPYLIIGRAKGDFFVNGYLSVVLVDAQGKVIAGSLAQTREDVEEGGGWVDFQAELNFSILEPIAGELLFRKDNPSGLPEQKIQVSYPVRLEP